MSNCITTHKPLAENVRGLCVFAVGFVHAHRLGASTVVLSDSRYTSPSVFGFNGSL